MGLASYHNNESCQYNYLFFPFLLHLFYTWGLLEVICTERLLFSRLENKWTVYTNRKSTAAEETGMESTQIPRRIIRLLATDWAV